MGDTDPTLASADTGPHAAASTSSAQTDESQEADPLIALGERIVAELGDPHTNNTLTRWLAHHVARLIRQADAAREAGAADADARETAAREAILQLWQARTAWPAWPPPRAAEIVKLLDDLPDLDGAGGWYRQTILGRLQDLHYHILSVLLNLVTDDADVEQAWLTAFGDMLTPDEARLLRRAAARPRHIDLLLRWCERGSDDKTKAPVDEDNAGEHDATPTHPLLRLADAYHGTIADLIRPRTPGAARDGNPDVNT